MEAINLKKQLNHQLSRAQHKHRILIVEDDVTSQPIWEYIIERADKNSSCDWAGSYQEADFKIKEVFNRGDKYDLIISDIFLSGAKTGIDLWSRYNHLLEGHMILISGIDHLKLMKRLSGFNGAPLYIKKPLVIDDCIGAVYNVLHHTPSPI